MALDRNGSALGVFFGGQEQSAFSVLIMLFTFTLIATLMIAQESPNLGPAPAQTSPAPTLDIATKLDEIHQHIVRHKELNGALPVPGQDPGYESDSNRSQSEDSLILQHYPDNTTRTTQKSLAANNSSSSSNLSSSIISPLLATTNTPICPIFVQEHLCHIPWTRWSILNYRSFIYLISKKIYRSLPANLTILFELPLVLRCLAMANFFSWLAIMSFNIFYTDFVGQMIYGGDPNAPEDSLERLRYDKGVRMGSWGLFFHCITSAIYAGFIDRLTHRHGLRATYMLGMISFTASMFIMVMSRSLIIVNLIASLTGLGYATLTTIPFMLVNTYHAGSDVRLFFSYCVILLSGL